MVGAKGADSIKSSFNLIICRAHVKIHGHKIMSFSKTYYLKRTTLVLLAVLATLLLAIPYLVQRQTVIDDSFITARHSRNLVRGIDLVFNQDQNVLGTTTPLWALLTTWIFLLPISDETQGNLISLFGGMMGLLGLYWWSRYWFPGSRFLSVLLFFALILAPSTADFFTMGMETGPLILFCALFWIALVSNEQTKNKWLMVVLLAQAILLLRLDAVFFIGSFGLAYLFLNQERKWRPLFTAGVVVSFLTLGCLWICKKKYGYYFPHSMLAKGSFQSEINFISPMFYKVWLEKVYQLLRLNFPWPQKYKWVFQLVYHASFLGAVLTAVLRWRAMRTNQKTALLGAFLYLLTYSLFLTLGGAGVYPWYGHIPCFIFFGVMTPILIELVRKPISSAIVLGVYGGILLMHIIGYSGFFVLGDLNSPGLHLGLFLKKAGCRSVMLEPIGYIGFFSDCNHVYDLAGLVSPEILEMRKSGKLSWFFGAVEKFQPQYIVLRRGEVERNVGFNVGVLFSSDQERQKFKEQYSQEGQIENNWNQVYSLYLRK